VTEIEGVVYVLVVEAGVEDSNVPPDEALYHRKVPDDA
jgi:hypothetical protein